MSRGAEYAVIVAPRADADVDGILSYIGESSLQNVQSVYERLLACYRSLETLPRRFPLAPENGAGGLEVRHTIVSGFRVVYSVQDHPAPRVVIETIRHAARLPADDLTAPE